MLTPLKGFVSVGKNEGPGSWLFRSINAGPDQIVRNPVIYSIELLPDALLVSFPCFRRFLSPAIFSEAHRR